MLCDIYAVRMKKKTAAAVAAEIKIEIKHFEYRFIFSGLATRLSAIQKNYE